MEETAARRAADTLAAEHKAGTQFKALSPASPRWPTPTTSRTNMCAAPREARRGGRLQGRTDVDGDADLLRHRSSDRGRRAGKRVHRSGASVSRADFGRLGLEFEIAVRIKSDMPASRPAFTAEAIAPHIDGVCAAIELVDDRGADYANLDVRSLVADNSWNGGIVLSDFVELARSRARARHGDARRRSVGEGYGRDILGHPFNSVAWLATQLARAAG